MPFTVILKQHPALCGAPCSAFQPVELTICHWFSEWIVLKTEKAKHPSQVSLPMNAFYPASSCATCSLGVCPLVVGDVRCQLLPAPSVTSLIHLSAFPWLSFRWRQQTRFSCFFRTAWFPHFTGVCELPSISVHYNANSLRSTHSPGPSSLFPTHIPAISLSLPEISLHSPSYFCLCVFIGISQISFQKFCCNRSAPFPCIHPVSP